MPFCGHRQARLARWRTTQDMKTSGHLVHNDARSQSLETIALIKADARARVSDHMHPGRVMPARLGSEGVDQSAAYPTAAETFVHVYMPVARKRATERREYPVDPQIVEDLVACWAFEAPSEIRRHPPGFVQREEEALREMLEVSSEPTFFERCPMLFISENLHGTGRKEDLVNLGKKLCPERKIWQATNLHEEGRCPSRFPARAEYTA